VLPVVALIDNSTRVDKPVARWVFLLVIAAGLAALFVMQAAVGIGLSGGV